MVISIIGFPYSGKSMVARELSASFECPVFSTGEYVRSLGTLGDEDVREFQTQDLSLRYDNDIRKEVISLVEGAKRDGCGIILDGYPRSVEQCDLLANVAGENVWVIYVYSNPVLLLDRVKDGNRNRLEDNVEVVKGRIDAAQRLKYIILDKSNIYHWPIIQWSSDGGRISDIMKWIAKYSVGGWYAPIDR